VTYLLAAAVSVLAEPPKNTGPDFGKASPVGLLVVVLLLIGTFALVWSMNRHLKRLPKTFDGDGSAQSDQPDQAGTEPSGDSDDTEKSAHEPGG
jgi:hypothetical protein